MTPPALPGLRPALALLLAALLWAPACQDKRRPLVSEDLQLQAKFETAARLRAQIERRKKRGKGVYGECQTAKMLLLSELEGLDHPEAKKVVTALQEACEKVKNE